MTQAARRTPNAPPAPPPSSRHFSARVDRGIVGSEGDRMRESGIVPIAPVYSPAHDAPVHDIGVTPLRPPRVKLVGPARAAMPAGRVTLCIYGWQNVQPGPLSWVFPSVSAAVTAAQAMRNATDWIVLEGQHSPSEIAWARSRAPLLASS